MTKFKEMTRIYRQSKNKKLMFRPEVIVYVISELFCIHESPPTAWELIT